MSSCRSCGAAIEWAVTADAGKRMPLDAGRFEDGNLVVVGGLDDGTPVVKVVGPQDEPSFDGMRRRSHFASCPQAGQWRR